MASVDFVSTSQVMKTLNNHSDRDYDIVRPDLIRDYCGFTVAAGEDCQTRCKRQGDKTRPSRPSGRHGQPPGVYGLDVPVDPCMLFGDRRRDNNLAESQPEACPLCGMGNGTFEASPAPLTAAILQVHLPEALMGGRPPESDAILEKTCPGHV